MHKSPRAVAAVGKIDAHGIAGIGELRDANAAVHQAQNFFIAEIVRGLGAQIAPRADFRRASPHLAHRLDLFAEDAVQFGGGIAGEQPLARCKLHGVGKGLVEFIQNRFGIHFASGELPVELRGQAHQ